mmetsp:Transcript_45736/g.97696  ORF Transcript_45736/g.97696 Transcript_45736/m.97696 type:complete len:389 (-) Transcript_45736:68-1234(-)
MLTPPRPFGPVPCLETSSFQDSLTWKLIDDTGIQARRGRPLSPEQPPRSPTTARERFFSPPSAPAMRRPLSPSSPPPAPRPHAKGRARLPSPAPSRCQTPPPRPKTSTDLVCRTPITGTLKAAPTTPPPLKKVYKCALTEALRSRSAQLVAEALGDDPMAAVLPLGGRAEPPVLTAVRTGCNPTILALLLQHHAEVDAISGDKIDQMTALSTIAQIATVEEAQPTPIPLPAWAPAQLQQAINCNFYSKMPPLVRMPGSHQIYDEKDLSEERCCEYASCLLTFGADPDRRDGTGKTPAEHAEANGRANLAFLIKNWEGKSVRYLQAHRKALERREQASICSCAPRGVDIVSGLICMPDVVFARICDMIAPKIGDWHENARQMGGESSNA